MEERLVRRGFAVSSPIRCLVRARRSIEGLSDVRAARVTCFVRLKYYGVQRDALEDRSEEKEANLGAQRSPR